MASLDISADVTLRQQKPSCQSRFSKFPVEMCRFFECKNKKGGAAEAAPQGYLMSKD